jgi:hypothetical protein
VLGLCRPCRAQAASGSSTAGCARGRPGSSQTTHELCTCASMRTRT